MKVLQMMEIWFLRRFPAYRRMSNLLATRGQEVYSLNNINGEQMLLIETQTAMITSLKRDIQDKEAQLKCLSALTSSPSRGKKR